MSMKNAKAKPLNLRTHKDNGSRDTATPGALKLQRETFRTSRHLDYFSKDGLLAQTGHAVEEWPLVIIRECLDNAIDAAEEHDISPTISVVADANSITVTDNGPGIPASTIEGVLDYTVRTSSRQAYVAPDRGKQGNALKTLVAMPWVVDRSGGCLIVEADGVRHRIGCRVDPVSEGVLVDHDQRDGGIKQGTSVRIEWAARVDDDNQPLWPFGRTSNVHETSLKSAARELLTGYALFNPHLTVRGVWFDEPLVSFRATTRNWQKWRANQPTNALWYEQTHIERLIGAYVAHDSRQGRRRTVADFLKLFDGLSSTAKRRQILEETDLGRVYLDQLAADGRFNGQVVAGLLAAMQARSRKVNPTRLGVIGRDHFVAHLTRLGCDPDHVSYARVSRVDNGIPFVLESAFGWLGDEVEDVRQTFTGVNWSAAIQNPFRSFGGLGGLESELTRLWAGDLEPVVFALHLAHPRVEYTDRGKSAIVIEPSPEEDDE
jgi:hypothetical protein